ncbi:MAG: ATP-binding cassette domain-containing protein [Alphaproteobacteria bacterium]|nr:MAG: ATP-binding cassette domain-containing protein [Alphaproteobacteria bacterium]
MVDSTEILSLRNVSLSYENIEVFRDISFVVSKGSFYYLTGESGAGKTSLLRLIYIDNLEYQGKIKLFEQNIKVLPRRTLPHIRQRIGVVKQEPGLIAHLTILQNTMLPLLIQGISPSKASRRAFQVLSWIGLQNYLEQLPSMLSGGHSQMAALARALVINPKIVIADEPTGNLDMKNARKLMTIFETLHKLGTTIVIATHNQTIVQEFRHPEVRLENKHLLFIHEQEAVSQTGTNSTTPSPAIATHASKVTDTASGESLPHMQKITPLPKTEGRTSVHKSPYSSFYNTINP